MMGTSKRYKSRIEETLGLARLAEDQIKPKSVYGTSKSSCGAGVEPAEHPTSHTSAGSENTGDSSDQSGHACDLCSRVWTPAIISAFETISADLHRTLPRLGVEPAAPHDADKPCPNGAPSSRPTERVSESNERPFDASLPSLLKSKLNVVGESTEVGVRPLPGALGARDGQQLYSRLRLLLETFVLLRPDIGYVQGMGYLAAMLLLYIDSDYEAFVCFTNLLVIIANNWEMNVYFSFTFLKCFSEPSKPFGILHIRSASG